MGYEWMNVTNEAARVLDGEPASSLPVIMDSPNKFMFDYVEMRKHGITMAMLPGDRIVVNEPPPFYRIPKSVLVVLVVSLLMLAVMVVWLILTIRQRRKAILAPRDSETRYRALGD